MTIGRSVSASMQGCLNESTVLAFLDGTLQTDERRNLETHIAGCKACDDLITWAAADQVNDTKRLPGHEGRPFVGQLDPGARVGRYQILGALGRGGMGEVYAAYHPDLDRRIALKVVYGFGDVRGERRVRLLREARAIARLSHPNVVTVHDAGTFGDRVFIAMELIDGRTIDRWLRAEARPWREVLDAFIAAGRGLAAAHAAGVIHRDFKPQNVMIAKNGAVRVMDFGLAQMAAEEAPEMLPPTEDESTVSLGPVTRTGAFVGTPAYMSPEQFRREAIDARSDQFSFCVALHEALYGIRPAANTGSGRSPPPIAELPAARGGVPAWLRGVVRRGASYEKEKRFSSMDALLTALERGRSRTRRASAIGLGLALVMVAGGGWRVARGNRFACAIPEDRVSAAWSGDAADPRRQAIHRAFAASGRATAETSWQRASATLDEYIRQWSAMYLQACEATHVRGEQSAEVLDLRMSCLNDNLDQVRALTDVLATADGPIVSHAVTGASNLTPVGRCADTALLKSAMPLPKDEKTLREVQRLRRSIAEIQALFDLGNFTTVLHRSKELRPEVEATGYKPLLSELLSMRATAESALDADPSTSEATLREAMIAAIASGDRVAVAKVASGLTFTTGYRLGRPHEAEFWAGMGHAVLDQLGGDQTRVRAWLASDLAAARLREGEPEGALVLIERAISLKEKSLGKEHPDLAGSVGDLAYALTAVGRSQDAVVAAGQAVESFLKYGDPDSFKLAPIYCNQGDALNALGHYSEAEAAFRSALRILSETVDDMHLDVAFALHGLGETKLAQGAPLTAVPLFEKALHIRIQPHSDPVLRADSEFGLARALRSGGGDQKRARSLAAAALKIYAEEKRPIRQRAVEAWLADRSKR